ncbi:YHYH protein [Microbulbifer sp. OS29]|uniref:YHYH protein n=1 Tax=Microbulbifer okhotskensis TaxID=2926617 RepID=A0A9X2ERI5_9GAMM|nr:YHYH protein [Microbulbifer okhotskensis]MCO1336489.1 YHYH protein [Microbulbifer okhotskensis]
MLIIYWTLASCGSGSGSNSSVGEDSLDDDSSDNDTLVNNAPKLVNLSSVINVVENTTEVVAVKASDDEGDSLSFSLSGADAAYFEISAEGLITLITPADYESKNVYWLTVSVSDEELSNAQNLVVSITDIGEEPSDYIDMLISSAAFKKTEGLYFNLPISYTCDGAGGGTSPLISWADIPDNTGSLTLTMHTVNTDGSVTPQFTVFNISPSIATLPEGSLSIGTAAYGDMTAAAINNAEGVPYSSPCATGAGTETLYVFSLYALTAELALNSDTTQADVLNAIEAGSGLISSQTLTTRRISWDAESLANNLHVPIAVPSTCEEKTAHFNEYAHMHSGIGCNEEENLMGVASYVPTGARSDLQEQANLVGITQWIGRIPLPLPDTSSFPIETSFLNAATNNMACSDSPSIGVSVDGTKILSTYRKNSSESESDSWTCGPNDGTPITVDMIVYGSIDQCHGHAPNGDGYHLHGPPICLMDTHDPSKPIAYMKDGIPLYFGQSGGTVENNPNAQDTNVVTTTNYGTGLYEHLDYRPADVIDGSNPLNECNAYDINQDGVVSGYVYYTSFNSPYTIGCFMGERNPEASGNLGLGQNLGWSWTNGPRTGWAGQTLGEPLNVSVIANYAGYFNDKLYNITELYVKQSYEFLTEGDTAEVLWRILDESDDDYQADASCFEFRYRANKNITDSDETETLCANKVINETTLSFTPFG